MTNKIIQDVELDDNEDVIEAHDPKNAEKQSIASMKASTNAGPTAKSRKGDKSNGEAMTKVKANMISVAHDLMSEMTEEELEDMIDMVMENGEVELDEVSADTLSSYMSKANVSRAKAMGSMRNTAGGMDFAVHKKRFDKRDAGIKTAVSKYHKKLNVKKLPEDYEIDYTDLNTLVASEATLSEEFKAKTALIFEAAVKSKLSEEIDRLEEAYAAELTEETATMRAEMVEKVDSYLNYVVETWMTENKLAVAAGLRTEIAETFMGKLKDLFTESYIEVPESKVDLVDELATANEELEEQLNGAVAKSIKLAEELEGYKRDAIIREAAKDLADTQVEKLKSLVEDIDFDDEKSFTQKVKTIKESYFKKKTAESVIDEETNEPLEEEVSASMAQYLKAIRRSN